MLLVTGTFQLSMLALRRTISCLGLVWYKIHFNIHTGTSLGRYMYEIIILISNIKMNSQQMIHYLPVWRVQVSTRQKMRHKNVIVSSRNSRHNRQTEVLNGR